MLTVYELARALAGHVSPGDAGDVIAKHLRRLIPSSLCVFYLVDPTSDEIEARHVVGEGASLVRGLRITLGQRLSGWVAANRQTISNSDPTLDLGDTARSHSLGLRSCLSTPLLSGDQLVGVLSLYSGEANRFNDDHRRIIEVVARQIAHILRRGIEFDNSSRRDSLTGLPDLAQLETLIRSTSESDPISAQRHSLLHIDVIDLNRINIDYGRAAGDEVLLHIVRYTRGSLRVADILFRNTSDEFVAFLNAADEGTAAALATRIRDSISQNPVRIPGGATVTVHTTVIVMSVPRDGCSLTDALRAAKTRTDHLANKYHGPGPSVH